jgi:hypothetical protein
MNKYFRLTFIFIGVWFVASFINGILSSLLLRVFAKAEVEEMELCILFSFIFSIPFIGLAWFIGIIACVNKTNGERLYEIILMTSFFIGFWGALFFAILLGFRFEIHSVLISLSIIVSAVSSILIFRKQIKSINNEDITTMD